MFSISSNNSLRLCSLFLVMFIVLGHGALVAGEIPVKDKSTKDAVKDTRDAVKDVESAVEEASEAISTVISGSLAAHGEGISASIGTAKEEIVLAIQALPMVQHKITNAQTLDPAIAKPSPASCARIRLARDAAIFEERFKEVRNNAYGVNVTHNQIKSTGMPVAQARGNRAGAVIALASEDTGLIDVSGITSAVQSDGSTDSAIAASLNINSLVNPFPKTKETAGGSNAVTQARASVFNSKKVVASDVISDVVSQRITKVAIDDPYVSKWMGGNRQDEDAGTEVAMTIESYRQLKNTYRRKSVDWHRYIETQTQPVELIRDLNMGLAQSLENEERIIQLLDHLVVLTALSYAQLVDNKVLSEGN